MQDIRHSTTETSPARSSPLAPCFLPDWPENPDWQAMAPPGMNSAWQRRLSWRTRDAGFAALLEFLEMNGRDTHLSENEWHACLNELLAHPPSRHFLFLLVFRQPDFAEFLQRLRLETALNTAFLQWKAQWNEDLGLTARVEQTCADEQLKGISTFRGVALCEALTYPTFRVICSKRQG